MYRIATVFALLCMFLSDAHAKYLLTQTVSVSTFDNMSNATKYDWLSEALADMITTDLAATKQLRVVSRLELKKILAEQQFQMSDLSSKSDVQLGQIVGAGVVVSGSYTIAGEQIRVDMKAFNVETGTSVGAATAMGSLEDVFVIEKELVIKFLRNLDPELQDDVLIRIAQMQTTNPDAFEANYRGVVALHQNDMNTAQTYFKRATQNDPYYQVAHSNLKQTSLKIEGNSLFANALGSLDAKEKQKQALKSAYDSFTDNYWTVQTHGKPEIQTNSNTPDVVTISVPVKVQINESAIQPFFNDLNRLSEGTDALSFATTIFTNPLQIYSENLKWLMNYNGERSSTVKAWEANYGYSWFAKSFQIDIMAGNMVVSRNQLVVSRFKGSHLDNPRIETVFYGQKVNRNKLSESKGQEIVQLNFNQIPISKVQSITEIRVTPID